MARRKVITRTRTYRPRRRKRKAAPKKGIDWAKVAMFGAGALIVVLALRPRRAHASVLPRSTVRAAANTARATGRSLESVLDDLLAEAKRLDPESILYIPAYGIENGDCVDANGRRVSMSLCKKCEDFTDTASLFTPEEFRQFPLFSTCVL